MQAVLLAAGKSTRTLPLTVNRPKALLTVANKTIIEHNLQQLKDLVKEVIVVVGFGEEQIKKHIGSSYGDIKIKYVTQTKQLGTAHALLQAKNHVRGRFVVLMGDDLYSREDIQSCTEHRYSVLGKNVEDLQNFGALVVRGNKLINVVEKPSKKMAAFANAACYVLDNTIFNYLKKVKKSKRKEYEITDALKLLAKKEKVIVETVRKRWVPITFPWSLLEANESLLKGIYSDIKGTVEKYVTIKGPIVVGKNSIVKNGAYIEGPVVIGENCVIGPNCFIRGHTSIGNNCKVGNGVEIKNSILMDGCRVDHLSYVGDSVLGEKAHLGAGTMIANLRHDNEEVKSFVKGKLVSTGRRKLGAILGDNVQTGINTTIYPGRKIWADKWTHPAEVVRKDVVK
jgi:bifunctional UDP-N-acetylglucosamine pyrophosphorylase/glucosamine-1-phosphate N-acetyltransferase